jgi:hypothetical protein
MGSGLFHLTLAMIRLKGDEGTDEATKLVEDLHEELQELLDRNKDKKQGNSKTILILTVILSNKMLIGLPTLHV